MVTLGVAHGQRERRRAGQEKIQRPNDEISGLLCGGYPAGHVQETVGQAGKRQVHGADVPPRKKNVPSVVMIAGTLSRSMMTALTAPIAAPIVTANTIARGQMMPWTMKNAAATPPTVRTEPTEKSKPPPMITSVRGAGHDEALYGGAEDLDHVG
jgi:hypothetical protein